MPDENGNFKGISVPELPWEVDDEPIEFEDTVGYCSKCGEAREAFYTCRDGGSTVRSVER